MDLDGADNRKIRQRLAMQYLKQVFPDDTKEHRDARAKFIFDGTSFFSVGDGLPTRSYIIKDVRKEYTISCVGNIPIAIEQTNNTLSQVLNVILKRAMSTELMQIGRNSYDAKRPVDLEDRIAQMIRVLPAIKLKLLSRVFQKPLSLL
jgi:hypothetical protein